MAVTVVLFGPRASARPGILLFFPTARFGTESPTCAVTVARTAGWHRVRRRDPGQLARVRMDGGRRRVLLGGSLSDALGAAAALAPQGGGRILLKWHKLDVEGRADRPGSWVCGRQCSAEPERRRGLRALPGAFSRRRLSM